LVHEATEEKLTTVIYDPGSFAPMMRLEQVVREEKGKSEKEQAMQEAMAVVEGLLAEGGMELKKPQAKPNELMVSFFVTDHAGTPSRLIDEMGTVIWQAEPDDWGAVRNEDGVRQPIRFQGQWLDEESGFYYNRYRYYDPQQGRYVTQDPIGFDGGLNVYGYPENPISNIDPKGLTALELALGAFAADVAIPEPSDLVPWKWLGWGLVLGGAALITLTCSTRNHTCRVRCNVQQIDLNANCPDRVTGIGTGPNMDRACNAAEKDANSKVPRGCYKRHCHPY
jgi:RHS repeat-associated protein